MFPPLCTDSGRYCRQLGLSLAAARMKSRLFVEVNLSSRSSRPPLQAEFERNGNASLPFQEMGQHCEREVS